MRIHDPVVSGRITYHFPGVHLERAVTLRTEQAFSHVVLVISRYARYSLAGLPFVPVLDRGDFFVARSRAKDAKVPDVNVPVFV